MRLIRSTGRKQNKCHMSIKNVGLKFQTKPSINNKKLIDKGYMNIK